MPPGYINTTCLHAGIQILEQAIAHLLHHLIVALLTCCSYFLFVYKAVPTSKQQKLRKPELRLKKLPTTRQITNPQPSTVHSHHRAVPLLESRSAAQRHFISDRRMESKPRGWEVAYASINLPWMAVSWPPWAWHTTAAPRERAAGRREAAAEGEAERGGGGGGGADRGRRRGGRGDGDGDGDGEA